MSNSVISRSEIVKVVIDITQNISRGRNFSLPLFVTKENTPGIDYVERVRLYSSLSEVAEDWNTYDEVYKMAQTFFSQDPKPDACLIGVRFEEDKVGYLQAGTSGSFAVLNSVSDGSFKVTIDSGPEQEITGLDLTGKPSYLTCGASGSLPLFRLVSDGSFKITIDGGIEQDITGLDFTDQAGFLTGSPAGLINNFRLIQDGSFNVRIDGGSDQEVTDLDFTDQPGFLTCDTAGILAAFQAIEDGAFNITIDGGTEQNITDLDFTGVAGFLTGGEAGSFTAFKAVSDGSFKITIDGGVEQDITGLDFTSITDMNDAAAIISAAITGATCVFETDKFIILSDTKGDDSEVSYLSVGTAGTDISSDAFINGWIGYATKTDGSSYTFSEIASIISFELTGAICSFDTDHFVFTSDLSGSTSTVSYLTAGIAGTDISGALYLNGQTGAGTITQGFTVDSYQDIEDIINNKLTGASCEFDTDLFIFTSDSVGLSSSVSYLSAALTGTDISGAGYLNAGVDAGISTQGKEIDSFDKAAALISAAIIGATCTYDDNNFIITSDISGSASSVSYLSAGSAGTDISGASYMNGQMGAGVIEPGVDFTDYDDLAQVITEALTGATCEHTDGKFYITSDVIGDGSKVSKLSSISPGVGTDISGSGYLNGSDVSVIKLYEGYTYSGITDELNRILGASDGAFFVAFTKEIRDNQDVEDIVGFLSALDVPYQFFTTTNNSLVLDPSVDTDIASELKTLGYNNVWVQFSSYSDQYPEVAAIGLASTVNFDGKDTLITMKFKALTGINPELYTSISAFNSAKLNTIMSKNANVYSQIGGVNMIASDGVMSSSNYQDEMFFSAWLADSLEVSIFNTLINSNKIPYTEGGLSILEGAMTPIFEQAIRNGGISPQVSEDGDFLPAYLISRIPVRNITPAVKAQRIYPGFSFIAYLSGAIHYVKTIQGELTIQGLST